MTEDLLQETDAQDQSVTEDQQPDQVEDQPTETPDQETVEEYNPNLKYKVYSEEREFDDLLKPLVKDKETEEHFRTMLSKSGSFDVLKGKYEDQKGRYDGVQKKVKEYEDTFGLLDDIAKDGDIESLLDTFKIPKEKAFEYVQSSLKLQDMDDSERDQYTRSNEAIRENRQLRREMEQHRSTQQQLELQRTQQEISDVINNPEVKDIVGSVDKRYGDGHFMKLLRAEGYDEYKRTGRDPHPLNVARKLAKTYAVDFADQQKSKPRPKSLPNVSGSAAQPMKKPMNFDELKKYLKTKYNKTPY